MIIKFHTPDGLVELAHAEEQFLGYRGAAFRLSLAANQGLYFPMQKRDYHTMWMKDVFIPLDIIFVDNGFVVGIVEHAVPQQTKPLYVNHPSTEVIEVNAGWCLDNRITLGTQVEVSRFM